MQRKVWTNGVLIDEKEARVSIYDEALQFGTVCFEMMRTFNKITFKLQEHIDRLAMSCKILEIDTSDWHLHDAHEMLLNWHIDHFPEVEEWRSLINVSRGILPLYQNMLGDEGKPNIMIACFPLSEILKGKSHLYDTGVKAIVPSQRAIPHHLLDARLKTRSRQHYQVANMSVAKQDPEAWALLLDEQGFIAEFTGSNIFILKDGHLRTPKGINCLRGISRQFIIDNFQDYFYEEADLTLFDLIESDGAFATCTPYSIVPITKVNNHAMGNEIGMTIIDKISRDWESIVGCKFREQARRWDAGIEGKMK